MKYLLLILSVALFSCSSEKRATKAIKRIGSKPMLKVLVLDYPELFTPTDTTLQVPIHDSIPYEVPVFKHDTVLKDAPPCQSLNYEDNFVKIDYENGELNYTIKKKSVVVPYNKTITVPHTCKPCPTVQIAQDIKNDYVVKSQPKDIQIIYKWWSWFSWLLIALIVGLFILKKYIKPV